MAEDNRKPWEIPIRYIDTGADRRDRPEPSDDVPKRSDRVRRVEPDFVSTDDEPLDYSKGQHNRVIDCTETFDDTGGSDDTPIDYSRTAEADDLDDLEDAEPDEDEFDDVEQAETAGMRSGGVCRH